MFAYLRGYAYPRLNTTALDYGLSTLFTAAQCCVARGDIRYEKTSCKPSPGTAEIERRRNFGNLRAVYLWRHTLLCQPILYKCAKNRDTLAYVVNYSYTFSYFFVLIISTFVLHMIYRKIHK
jgi:hypothetical protein